MISSDTFQMILAIRPLPSTVVIYFVQPMAKDCQKCAMFDGDEVTVKLRIFLLEFVTRGYSQHLLINTALHEHSKPSDCNPHC